MLKVKDLIKDSNIEYFNVAADGVDSDVKEFIDSGSYSLNALLSGSIYGGFPDNKIVALAGEPSTGKTYAALTMSGSFLKKYKDAIVFYFDSEQAITTQMILNHDIDPKRFVIIPVCTVEEFRGKAVKLLDAYEAAKDNKTRLMFVLDSLGMLSSKKEMEDVAADKDTKDMTKPGTIKSIFRVLTLKCGKLKVPFIVCNHVYSSIGGYIPTKTQSGGSGTVYAASIILFLSKSKEKDADKEQIGVNIRCNMQKGRLTKEGKSAVLKLSYENGLQRFDDSLFELAEKYDIVKKSGKKYKFPDGREEFQNRVMEEPEKWFTKDVLDKLDIAAAKEFKYAQKEPADDSEDEQPET